MTIFGLAFFDSFFESSNRTLNLALAEAWPGKRRDLVWRMPQGPRGLAELVGEDDPAAALEVAEDRLARAEAADADAHPFAAFGDEARLGGGDRPRGRGGRGGDQGDQRGEGGQDERELPRQGHTESATPARPGLTGATTPPAYGPRRPTGTAAAAVARPSLPRLLASASKGSVRMSTPPPRPFGVSAWSAGVLAVSDDDRAFKHGLGNDNRNDDDRGGRAKHSVLSGRGRHWRAV